MKWYKIIIIKLTNKGIIFLLTTWIAETLAISDVAINTPETGETVLPIDAAKFIGSINSKAWTSNFWAISGAKGPKEKNAALPLPIIIADKNIKIVITTPIPRATKPKLSERKSRAFIKFKLSKPEAKISATIINVTTDLKILPIPNQNVFNDSKTDLIFLLLKNSNMRAIKRLINIADEVSKTNEEPIILEK